MKFIRSHKVPLAVLSAMCGFWSFHMQGFWGLGFWALLSAFGFWFGRNEDKLL